MAKEDGDEATVKVPLGTDLQALCDDAQAGWPDVYGDFSTVTFEESDDPATPIVESSSTICLRP